MYRVIISALLSASWVLFPEAWPLSIFGISLFLYSLVKSSHCSQRVILLKGCMFGVVYVGCTLFWFWEILPLDWMNVSSAGSMLVLFLSWLFVACTLGSVFSFFSLVYRWHGNNSFFVPFFAASLWVMCEYAQMWLFAFLTWGEASAKNAHFSGTFVGHSIASFSPLLQLASVGGIYALSFTAVFIGALLSHIYSKVQPNKKNFLILLAVLMASFVLIIADIVSPLISSAPNDTPQTLRVGLVSTQFTHAQIRDFESRYTRHEQQKGIVSSAVKNDSSLDLLVFPEGAANFSDGQSTVTEFLDGVFPNKKPVIIDSTVAFENNRRFERMSYWDQNGRVISNYDKVFLVPQGEYTPNITHFVLRMVGMESTYQGIKKVSPGFTPGETVNNALVGATPVGGLFCSDVLSPQLYRQQTNEGAEILINAASHALFHNSPLVDQYIMTISKVRAVENSRYLLVAGNGVSSSVISDTGEVLARSIKGTSGVLMWDVPQKNNRTPYTALGEWVLFIPALLCLVCIDQRFRSTRKETFA